MLQVSSPNETALSPPPFQRPAPPVRPRVLHVISHIGLGGAERVCFTLMRHLRPFADNEVFAANGVESSRFADGMLAELAEMQIPLHQGTHVPNKLGGVVLAALACRSAVRLCRPDLVHLYTELPEATWASLTAMFPRYRRIPVLRSVQNCVLWPCWRAFGGWCERQLDRAGAYAACCSRGALDGLNDWRHARGLPDADSQRTSVIYNGVPLPDGPTRRRRPDSDPTTLRMLFAARLEDQKGADLLPQILAAVRLPPDVRECQLVIYGHGTHQPLLRTLANQPPPRWTVHVDGALPSLSGVFDQFDLALMPSRFEGIGLFAIEAIVSGTPVIATDTPGLNEVFPPGYPFLAAPGSPESFSRAIERAIAQHRDWPVIVDEASRFAVDRFDARAMAASFQELYAKVLGIPAQPHQL